MRKAKGRAEHYEEPRFIDDGDDFDAGETFDEHGLVRPKPRNVALTRQRLEMRDEEQWLRKQIADWDDEDFDWEEDDRQAGN